MENTVTRSRLDENREISQEQWSVTLIRQEHHAEIIIEGIDSEGTYLCKLLHLIGYGSSRKLYSNIGVAKGIYPGCTSKPGIEIKDLSSKSAIIYHAKSPTWEISKSAAESMIENTKQEAKLTSEHMRFSLFGRHSFFNIIKQMMGFPTADSCITWALNKLLYSGIKVSVEGDGLNLFTTSSRYTQSIVDTQAYTINDLCQFAKTGNIDAIRLNFIASFNVNQLTENACVGPVESYLGWYTPLALAVAYNQLEVTKILINEYGADPLIKSGRNQDFTALDCARHNFWFTGKKDARVLEYLSSLEQEIEESKRSDSIDFYCCAK